MVLLKIFVAAVLTKLPRSESGANERSRLDNVRQKVCGFRKILHIEKVKFNADFEHDIDFDHTGF